MTYITDTGELRGYDITMLEDNIREVRITDEKSLDTGTSGIEIGVTEPHREYRSLESDEAVQEFAEIFTLYLKDYRDVSILYEGMPFDPTTAIASRHLWSRSAS